MTKRRMLAVAIIFMGALLSLGDILFITLGIDTVQPVFQSTMPVNGQMDIGWVQATQKYSCRVTDAGGVQRVTYTDSEILRLFFEGYLSQNYVVMQRVSGTALDGVYEAPFADYVYYAAGFDYPYEFQAKDLAGNTGLAQGTFTVYEGLAGKWYINDQQVTSPTQTIWLNTNMVTFKFVKSKGVPDDQITCTVTWTSDWEPTPQVLTVPHQAANIWYDTYDIEDSTYDVQLKASDGTGTITFSIYRLQIGDDTDVQQENTVSSQFLVGIGMLCVGFILYLSGKAK